MFQDRNSKLVIMLLEDAYKRLGNILKALLDGKDITDMDKELVAEFADMCLGKEPTNTEVDALIAEHMGEGDASTPQ